MIWVFQIFKVLKLFIAFIKALSNILDGKKDSSTDLEIGDEEADTIEETISDISEEDAPIEESPSEEEKDLPATIEKAEVIPKKSSDPLISNLVGIAGFAAGFVGVVYLINKFFIPTYSKVPKALTGEVKHFKVDEGVLGYYKEGEGPPLVLIHGINPGASSHEMSVIFNHYRINRTVYSLDLLGYGLSDRPEMEYTPHLYLKHITELLTHVKTKYDKKPDVIALGLTTEYIVAIAEQDPDLFNKIILISPTGLEDTINRVNLAINKATTCVFKLPVLGQGLFNLITSKTVLKKYLAKNIFVDPRNLSYLMLQQYYYTTHVKGAKNAPAYYVAGELIIDSLFQKYLNLKVPTLITYGTGCQHYSKFNAVKTLARDNNFINEKVVEDSGLLVHIEKPDIFFNTVNKFFNS